MVRGLQDDGESACHGDVSTLTVSDELDDVAWSVGSCSQRQQRQRVVSVGCFNGDARLGDVTVLADDCCLLTEDFGSDAHF